jgi:hypothetical protein
MLDQLFKDIPECIPSQGHYPKVKQGQVRVSQISGKSGFYTFEDNVPEWFCLKRCGQDKFYLGDHPQLKAGCIMDAFGWCNSYPDESPLAAVIHESEISKYKDQIRDDDYRRYVISFTFYFDATPVDDLVLPINTLTHVVLLEMKRGGSKDNLREKFIRIGFSEDLISKVLSISENSDIKVIVDEIDHLFRDNSELVRSFNIPTLCGTSISDSSAEWKFLMEGVLSGN